MLISSSDDIVPSARSQYDSDDSELAVDCCFEEARGHELDADDVEGEGKCSS